MRRSHQFPLRLIGDKAKLCAVCHIRLSNGKMQNLDGRTVEACKSCGETIICQMAALHRVEGHIIQRTLGRWRELCQL